MTDTPAPGPPAPAAPAPSTPAPAAPAALPILVTPTPGQPEIRTFPVPVRKSLLGTPAPERLIESKPTEE